MSPSRMVCQLTLLAAAASILAACVSGPPFSALDSVPPGKAVVYIYRPGKFFGSGVSYDVRVGDDPIVTLRPGGYYPFLAEPGETEFWARTEARASVSEYLKAGQTYYLKGGIGLGFAVGHPKLEFVDPATGSREIAECKLLEAAD